jgi:O-antigen/teichoic acid export membrane protein/glycosyltransferase involved in cell wall biosynthesis
VSVADQEQNVKAPGQNDVPEETPPSPPKAKDSLRSRAISGTKWTIAGFGIANGVRFAGNIVLSHILNKADPFGVMQLANAILQGVTMLSDVGIGPNIIQNKRGEDPRFLNTAWTVQVIRGLALWVVLLALTYPIANFYDKPDQPEIRQGLLHIIPLIGLTAFFSGFNATAIYTLNKRLNVRALTLMQLVSQVVGVAAMVIVAYFTQSVIALALAGIVQAFVKLVISHMLDRSHRNRFAWDRDALRNLLGFGTVVFISSALTFLGGQGDKLILGKQVSMEILGLYGVALMISKLPLDVINNIGSGVAFPAYAHAFNSGRNFESVFRKVRFPLCVTGAFCMAGIAIAGPGLIRLFWPESFHDAGTYLPYLCIGAMFQVLEITSGQALLAMGKIKYLAIGNALRVATLVGGLVIGFHYHGFEGALIGMIASDFVRYLTSAFFARREGLPIFGHDFLLYLLTIVAYFAAKGVDGLLPILKSRELNLIEHIVVDGFVVLAFFAWPLYLVAKEFLARHHVPPPPVLAPGKLRITFVLSQLGMQGGIRVIAQYAQHLHKQGHEVTVVAPELRSRSWLFRRKQFLKGLLMGGGLAPASNSGERPRPPSHFDGTDVKVRLLESRREVTASDVPDADVVIATWWETAEWVAALPPSKGFQVYFVQGHEVWEGQPVKRVELTYHLPLRKIAVSEWLSGIMRDRYGDESVTTIPNGVDFDRFMSPPREKQAQPTVGFIYSEQSIKGSDLAIAAIERARQMLPELRVVSFGMFAPTGAMKLPKGTQFSVRPPHPKLVEGYASCDAWIVPSRNEGFGLPLLEAMACRTPVIATPAGAAPQIVGAGGGILVEHENVEALARAIVRVAIMNAEEWRSMSDNAFATAMRYDSRLSAQKFESFLQQMVVDANMPMPEASQNP